MLYFYSPHKQKSILCVITLAVFLRSLIAMGYMLEASPKDGLDIVFCDGLVSLFISKDNHTAHHHHGGKSDAQQEIHISPICSQWSTSSVLVVNALFEPLYIFVNHSKAVPFYQTLLITKYFSNTHDIRGPPIHV